MRDKNRHEYATGGEAHEKARHMARYSRREWIAWTSKDETRHFAQLLTAQSLKAALLDNGSQRRDIWGYYASRDSSYLIFWGLGVMMLRKFNMGYEPRSQGGKGY